MSVTENTDDAVVLLTSKLNTVYAAFEQLEAQLMAANGRSDQIETDLGSLAELIDGQADTLDTLAQNQLFPIWAEESGAMANNAFEWSWGNGAVGTDIGVPVSQRCQLVSATFNADAFGTSISVNINRNNTSVELPLFEGQNDLVNFTNPVVFEAGDLVSFRTGVVTGSYTDSRVCAWFRVI